MILLSSALAFLLGAESVLWAVAGVLCGVLAAVFWTGRKYVLYEAVIGGVAFAIGGLCGRYGFDSTTWLHFIINTLIGLFVTGICLWLFNNIVHRNPRRQ